MGKLKVYRQRANSEAGRVQKKTLFEFIVNMVMQRREIAYEEAKLLAEDALFYLNQSGLKRGLGEITIPAISGRKSHKRQSERNQPLKMVRVNLISDEDASCFREFGMKAALTGRLARVIEEAYFQDALLDLRRLCLLFTFTAKALRERLAPLWRQGALLPICGMPKKKRESLEKPRGVIAMERYVSGDDPSAIRKDLFLSEGRFRRYWRAFRMVASSSSNDVEKLSEMTGEPPELVAGWLSLWQKRPDKCRRRLSEVPSWEPPQEMLPDPAESFYHVLIHRHRYTPAAAENFIMELSDLARSLSSSRKDGQVVYVGVESDEPPGKSISASRLSPVVIDYLCPEDWDLVNPDSPQALKWERIRRFSTQAYQQGVSLSLPDLAFLLGISTDAVSDCMREHPKVVLPTRGITADMGPAISHAKKIITLYLNGYDETEIVRRTGHSYDSVERYLINFGRVVLLLDHGMRAPAIRRVTGLSLKVVKSYEEIYREHQSEDHAWCMAQVRRLASAHPGKAQRSRKE